MNTYNFTRKNSVHAAYDIDNPDRTDGEGEQIHLAKEVEAVLPNKTFRVVCNADDCAIIFDAALSVGEKTTLSTVVLDHQNNV